MSDRSNLRSIGAACIRSRAARAVTAFKRRCANRISLASRAAGFCLRPDARQCHRTANADSLEKERRLSVRNRRRRRARYGWSVLSFPPISRFISAGARGLKPRQRRAGSPYLKSGPGAAAGRVLVLCEPPHRYEQLPMVSHRSIHLTLMGVRGAHACWNVQRSPGAR
jgi:hypothetical protein